MERLSHEVQSKSVHKQMIQFKNPTNQLKTSTKGLKNHRLAFILYRGFKKSNNRVKKLTLHTVLPKMGTR